MITFKYCFEKFIFIYSKINMLHVNTLLGSFYHHFNIHTHKQYSKTTP